MRIPPEPLQPLLHSIESTISETYKTYPRLIDKDVEAALERLEKYFHAIHLGKEVDEPEVGSKMKQAIMDNILEIIDAREEVHADDFLLNDPDIFGGVHSLDRLYTKCLKFLVKSIRFWRKKDGRTGYLTFISNHV